MRKIIHASQDNWTADWRDTTSLTEATHWHAMQPAAEPEIPHSERGLQT